MISRLVLITAFGLLILLTIQKILFGLMKKNPLASFNILLS